MSAGSDQSAPGGAPTASPSQKVPEGREQDADHEFERILGMVAARTVQQETERDYDEQVAPAPAAAGAKKRHSHRWR